MDAESVAEPVAESVVKPVALESDQLTGHHQHPLHLDHATRQASILRLKTVKGHIEGVLRMLEDEGVYCVDVLKQVKAISGALGKVSETVLRSHIQDHVTTAMQRGDAEEMVDELMEALKYRA